MIQSIRIRNFKCIKDISIDLTFGEARAPNDYRTCMNIYFAQRKKGPYNRVCVAFGIYGPNGCGKTAILQAVDTLTEIVCRGIKPTDFQPYRFGADKSKRLTTTVGMTYWVNARRYSYDLTFDADGIIEEVLCCNDEQLYAVRQNKIECGSAMMSDGEKAMEIFEARCLHPDTKAQVRTFLQEASQAPGGVNVALITAAGYFANGLLFVPDGKDGIIRGIELLSATFKGTAQERQEQALKELTDYLYRLDLGVKGLRLIDADLSQEEPSGREKVLEILRKAENRQFVHLTLNEESAGTQRIILCMAYFLAAVRSGKTVFVDDLDRDVHGLVLENLVRMFKAHRLNPNDDKHKGQIIFTVKNTDLIAQNILCVSDIGVISHAGFSGPELIRLCDFEGLKNSVDFRKSYLKGCYGGLPNVYL